MATKRDILKVMEMDKMAILRKIENMKNPDTVMDKVYQIAKDAFSKAGLDPKITGVSYYIYDTGFEEYITDENLKKELLEVAKISIEHKKKKDELKRKVEAEFKVLERAILLQGAGEAAEMLAKRVESLTEEVNNGL